MSRSAVIAAKRALAPVPPALTQMAMSFEKTAARRRSSASEYGRLCHGDAGHAGSDRCRRGL